MKGQALQKELYKIKTPQRIVFGDPMYFEQYKGQKLKKLVVDYIPPKGFEARLELEQYQEAYGPVTHTMYLYLAPEKEIDTYVAGYKYKTQKLSGRKIGVDTAHYLLNIDSREDELSTLGDGQWGLFTEIKDKETNVVDGVIVAIGLPEDYDFEGMKKLAGELFEDMQPVNKENEKKKGDRDGPAR